MAQSDPIMNQIRNLLACSVVAQPTAPLHTVQSRGITYLAPYHSLVVSYMCFIYSWLNNTCRTSGCKYTWSVPKVMRMIKKFFLLNIHVITVYPLQNRLLVIEYSDSSVAATLHSSGGSLHLRRCSKPSLQLPGRFQLSQNDVL